MIGVVFDEIAAILLFFYAIHRFSKIIARCNIHKLKKIFKKITNNKVKSLFVGVFSTALMQSNKAVSSIVLTLVNTGVITATSSLPILFGTTIGGSSTAFLVSLKFKHLEELLIICGAIIKKTKYKNIGHIIFYLGLLLFSLELMSKATIFLRDEEWFKNIFLFSNNVVVLFVVGCFMSFLLQSGALIVSIITILVNCSVLPLYNAVILGIGVTVGSTLSLIIVTYSMSDEVKKTCYFYIFLIAIFGFFVLPFAQFFVEIGQTFKGGIGFAVSNLIARTIISFIGCVVAIVCIYIKKKDNSKIKQFILNKSKKHNANFETNLTDYLDK